MIKLKLQCDLCNRVFGSSIQSFPKGLLRDYKTLEKQAIEDDWVYHTSNKRLYCPNCAAYMNAYKGELASKNRNNNPEWHYVNPEGGPVKDLPVTEMGVSETVINQDGDEVFWGNNSGWLYKDPAAAERAGSPYAKVYRWRSK